MTDLETMKRMLDEAKIPYRETLGNTQVILKTGDEKLGLGSTGINYFFEDTGALRSIDSWYYA